MAPREFASSVDLRRPLPRRECPFRDSRRGTGIVTVSDPCRPGSKVADLRILGPILSIGKALEVYALEPPEIFALRLIDRALELDGTLVTPRPSTHDKGCIGSCAKIARLSRRRERIEEEFQLVGYDEPDQRGLRGSRAADRRYHRPPMGPEKSYEI